MRKKRQSFEGIFMIPKNVDKKKKCFSTSKSQPGCGIDATNHANFNELMKAILGNMVLNAMKKLELMMPSMKLRLTY